MSEEQLKAFIEKVAADTSLQEKLKAAADTDAVIAVAKATGFIISADDIENSPLFDQSSITELSDEDLEAMDGGTIFKIVQGVRNFTHDCKPNSMRTYWGVCGNG